MALRDALRAAVVARAEVIHAGAVETVLAAAREAAPRREGALAGSIREKARVVTESRISSLVGSDLPYAVWQDQGTGVHGPRGARIYPVQARALRFEIDGVVIFAASVAGAPATRFWSDNVTQATWSAALAAAQ